MVGLVDRISAAQRHRGPDGSGIWQSEAHEVVFGHRRLAILDLSDAGAQPMLDDASSCAVTFNGEIYNFGEIRADLEGLGETFRSSCDTEVILKAYRHWGIDVVSRFRGIFAFALWDPRARLVHLVRDPMGIKPLYWTTVRDRETGGDVVAFASEVRALLASGIAPPTLDPAAVASYLWHGFVIGPRTIISGIHLLPAATVLTIDVDSRSSLRSRRYWQMPREAGPVVGVAELRDELARTVRMQLVADVPLGVFLSGGVDSSAVAALASEAVPGAVHTFTVGFEDPAFDESPWALQVAESIGSRHTCVVLSEDAFRRQLPDAFTSIDQPTFDGINTYFVSRAARDAGMTVALAGTGGDELFGGYASFADIPKAMRAATWLPFAGGDGLAGRLFGHTVALSARTADAFCWRLLKRAPPQTRWAKAADVIRSLDDPLGLYQLSYALFTPRTQAALSTGRVRAAQGSLTHGLEVGVAADWRGRFEGSSLLHTVSTLELSSFIGERLLRDTDAASMAVALEVRVPLLDHVLAETVARVGASARFSPIREKRLLRRIALSGMDSRIFDRPKAGFVLPIERWARQQLEAEMDEVFRDEALADRVGLDGDTVLKLWRSFVRGHAGLYWSRVWAIYVLMKWTRIHGASLPSESMP